MKKLNMVRSPQPSLNLSLPSSVPSCRPSLHSLSPLPSAFIPFPSCLPFLLTLFNHLCLSLSLLLFPFPLSLPSPSLSLSLPSLSPCSPLLLPTLPQYPFLLPLSPSPSPCSSPRVLYTESRGPCKPRRDPCPHCSYPPSVPLNTGDLFNVPTQDI